MEYSDLPREQRTPPCFLFCFVFAVDLEFVVSRTSCKAFKFLSQLGLRFAQVVWSANSV